MRVWLIFIGCGLVTYCSRASFLLFGDRISLPSRVQRSLDYVAPAAFAAIAVPAVLGSDGLSSLAPPNAAVIAVLIAGVVVAKSRNMAVALVIGMASLWLLQWAGL